ncbi:unnamed protein product [Calypogeia fissa]
MKSLPKRSHSISSAYSDKSELQGYSSGGSSTMGSTRSRGPSRDDSPSNDDSMGPTVRHPADLKSTRGLTHVVQSTIAKLKKKGGCPVNSIKQEIKENYGFALTSTTNSRRLNAVLKKLQKQGKIIKTKRGFKLVPISEARRRRRRHSHHKGHKKRRRRRRRRRRRKGRGKRRRRRRRTRRRRKSKGKKRGRRHHRRRRRRRRRRSRHHKKGKGRHHHRRRHRRRRKRRRRSRGRKHTSGPKTRRLRGAANLALSGGGSPGPLIGGPSRGGYVPRGGSPCIPSRNASRLPSRAPSRLPSQLPSRSHSPGRPGFDPRETPPTRSRHSSARASARNSPGPHLMASLDDYDL